MPDVQDEPTASEEQRRLFRELRSFRLALGWSHQDVADCVARSRSRIVNAEAGRGSSFPLLVDYAAALGLRLKLEEVNGLKNLGGSQ